MKVQDFVKIIGGEFFTGVPDSLLKPLVDYLIDNCQDNKNHVIAANEGNAVAIGAGYHLATGNVPVIYMQNSGEGNAVNPIASLLHPEVYGIPELFIIGWRGEPGVKDEPQHVFQGEITLKLLEILEIKYYVIRDNTTLQELSRMMEIIQKLLQQGKSAALVVAKGALIYKKKQYANGYLMKREDVLEHILAVTGDNPIISTTGKTSRELFELREKNKLVDDVNVHSRDFLTVGSMGHSSSIALGMALQLPEKKIWCIDGDGAILMHGGAMAIIGKAQPENLIHVVINNEAHESVGGQTTAANAVDLTAMATACGYKYAHCVADFASLDKILEKYAELKGLRFLEIKAAIGSRTNLGRPSISPSYNKKLFIDAVQYNRGSM